MKRGGGRRYYRPSDMRIIGGVKVLLHDQGMTIRGVQKLFREEGLKHVSGFSPRLFDEDEVDTAAPLDEDALEEAARPAQAARVTRTAEPDPIPDDRPVAEPTDEPGAVVFRHKPDKTTAAPEKEPATDESQPELVFVRDAKPDYEKVRAPGIPPTPDVPEADPADDDEAHAKGSSIAARLAIQSAEYLEAHREALESAATRLKALLDRAS